MLLFVPALLLTAVYLVLRRRDRRMLRNGVVLLAAAFFTVLAVVDVSYHRFPVVEVLLVGVFLALPLALLVLVVFLVANGIRMFRREGRSLGNLLSLVAGVAVTALAVVSVVVVRSGNEVLIGAVLLPLLVAGYVAAVFVVFIVSAVVYGRTRVPDRVGAIIVLGSGLIEGKVPPLLRSRLDRALGVWRASGAAGVVPVLVPSGGQGADEPRAEGDAMAEYLVAQGVPAASVLPETRSTTTEENLVLSARVLDGAGVSPDDPLLVVTSDYHVMRAAMLARSLGSPAQVAGARTARYYVPSAFLREFAAVLWAHRVGHLVAVVGIVALWVAVFTAVLRSS